jgi:hypothetical protein
MERPAVAIFDDIVQHRDNAIRCLVHGEHDAQRVQDIRRRRPKGNSPIYWSSVEPLWFTMVKTREADRALQATSGSFHARS